MPRRSAITALLVPSGLLAGHAISAAGTHTLGFAPGGLPHPVVELLGAVAVPLAALFMVGVVTSARPLTAFSSTRLAAYQTSSYTALVGGQAWLHGIGLDGLAHDPVVWIGIAGQLIGALLLSLLTTSFLRLHRRQPHRTSRQPIAVVRSWRHRASTPVPARVVDAVIRRRGPPGRSFLPLPSRS